MYQEIIKKSATDILSHFSAAFAHEFDLDLEEVLEFVITFSVKKGGKIGKTTGAKKKTPIKRAAKKQEGPKIELKIRTNAHGNYEHPETGFVFNGDKKVYGKQSGKHVLSLTTKDIDECKSRKFPYVLPVQLTGADEDGGGSDVKSDSD